MRSEHFGRSYFVALNKHAITFNSGISKMIKSVTARYSKTPNIAG